MLKFIIAFDYPNAVSVLSLTWVSTGLESHSAITFLNSYFYKIWLVFKQCSVKSVSVAEVVSQ